MSEPPNGAVDGVLWYPRNPGEPDSITVTLYDVRAADELIVSFDFERNGWRIGMDVTYHDPAEGFTQVVEPNAEVAFIPAWNEMPSPAMHEGTSE